MPAQRKTTRPRTTTPKVPKEPKPNKKINPAFLALQIKAEAIVNKYLDDIAEKQKEQCLNRNTLETLHGLAEAIMAINAMGLIQPDRPEIE